MGNAKSTAHRGEIERAAFSINHQTSPVPVIKFVLSTTP
jgi:hypothetical protein